MNFLIFTLAAFLLALIAFASAVLWPIENDTLVCKTQFEVFQVVVRSWFRRRKKFLLRHLLCRFYGCDFSGDSGLLLGSRMADVWCRRCDRHTQIPIEESKYAQMLDDDFETPA